MNLLYLNFIDKGEFQYLIRNLYDLIKKENEWIEDINEKKRKYE